MSLWADFGKMVRNTQLNYVWCKKVEATLINEFYIQENENRLLYIFIFAGCR